MYINIIYIQRKHDTEQFRNIQQTMKLLLVKTTKRSSIILTMVYKKQKRFTPFSRT